MFQALVFTHGSAHTTQQAVSIPVCVSWHGLAFLCRGMGGLGLLAVGFKVGLCSGRLSKSNALLGTATHPPDVTLTFPYGEARSSGEAGD